MRRLLAWIGRHEISVILAFAAIAGGMLLFGEIADQVVDGGTKRMDQRILLSFRTPGTLQPIGGQNAEVAARDVTALGGVVVLTLLTVFVSGYLALDGKRGMAMFVFGAIMGGMAVSVVLKDVFQLRVRRSFRICNG